MMKRKDAIKPRIGTVTPIGKPNKSKPSIRKIMYHPIMILGPQLSVNLYLIGLSFTSVLGIRLTTQRLSGAGIKISLK